MRIMRVLSAFVHLVAVWFGYKVRLSADWFFVDVDYPMDFSFAIGSSAFNSMKR